MKNRKARRNMFREFMDGDWRVTDNLVPNVVYKKRFALFPIKTAMGECIWLKNYYRRQVFWSAKFGHGSHPDRPIKISSEDYVVYLLKDK